MSFMDLFSLTGKTAVITGGAGYFGQRFVQGLLDAGAACVVIVEKQGMGGDFRANLPAKGGRVAWYETDLDDHARADVTYDEIIAAHGPPDVLVNNAFIFGSETGFEIGRREVLDSATYEEFRRCFDAALWWHFQAMQKLGPLMQERGSGSIVNIASSLAVIAPSKHTYAAYAHAVNPIFYGPAKNTVLALTRRMADLLAPVRVNALCPGAIPNLGEGRHKAGKEYEDTFLNDLAKRMVLGRCGNVDELVAPLIFLASEASSYISGFPLFVDGGWTVTSQEVR